MIFNITSSGLTGTTLVVETLAGVTVTITKYEKRRQRLRSSHYKGVRMK